MNQTLEQFGFIPVGPDGIDEFHALADELIAGEVAGPEALRRVQSYTGRALHIRRRKGCANALLASIPLTAAGRTALLSGDFSFANARPEWMCRLDQPAAALLSWGMAGRGAAAQAASVRGLLAGWHGYYRSVRVFARGRSQRGQALLGRLGFEYVGAPDGGAPLFASNGFPDQLNNWLSRPASDFKREEYA